MHRLSDGYDSSEDSQFKSIALRSFLKQLDQEELPGIFGTLYTIRSTEVLGVCIGHMDEKLQCYREIGDLSGAGYDLVAKSANSLAAEYVRPQMATCYIWMAKANEKVIKKIGAGVNRACKKAGLTLIGCEIAEMPSKLQEEAFCLGGAVMGIEYSEIHEKRIERRAKLRQGESIIGLPSSGLHCEGFHYARRLHETMKWDEKISRSDKTLIEELTTPVRLYSPLMDEIDHFTDFFVPVGDGGYGNLYKVLPPHLDAKIRIRNPPSIFKIIKDRFGIDEKTMYVTFNMGFGMLVGTDVPEAVIEKCRENQIKAEIIGELKRGQGRVMINRQELPPD